MTKAELLDAYLSGKIDREEFEVKALLQAWLACEQPNGLWRLYRRCKVTYHTREEIFELKSRLPRWIVLNCMDLAEQQSDPMD